jgi:hypothetical protein
LPLPTGNAGACWAIWAWMAASLSLIVFIEVAREN